MLIWGGREKKIAIQNYQNNWGGILKERGKIWIV